MWHAYNLIRPNDLLTAPAVRRVTTESSVGANSSERVHVQLTLRVTALDFDPQAGQLHVVGRVAVENAVVKLGAHHTLDLELHRHFKLEKHDGWDSVALATLKESVDTLSRADLWAVVMQEGIANICLITTHQTILRQRLEVPLPKKRPGLPTSDHQRATSRFFSQILTALSRDLDLKHTSAQQQTAKPLLLASPGFTASEFLAYMRAQAVSKTDKSLSALCDRSIVAHSASGHLHALAEVLASPALTAKLGDTRFARETAHMDRFFELLRRDDGRAWYGPREVEACVDRGAVGRGGGVLLILNSLFRAQDVGVRRRWVGLVDRVAKEQGGEVRVLSEMHESGKRLEGLGGIAAILTYPIDDLGLEDEVERAADSRRNSEELVDRAAGAEGREAIHEDIFI